MDLNSRQLFTLNEMGIPVWELRSDDSSYEVAAPIDAVAVNHDEVVAQIRSCELIVLTASAVTNEQEKRLLHALVFSLGLKFNGLLLMTNDEFVAIEDRLSDSPQKLLLILGRETASVLVEGFELSDAENTKTYTTKVSQWPAYISYSLEILLKKTQLKSMAWQNLKLIKSKLAGL